MLEPPFNKDTGLQACIFIKKRLQHTCFPVNITKCLRAAFFIEHLRWLLPVLRSHCLKHAVYLIIASINDASMSIFFLSISAKFQVDQLIFISRYSFLRSQ